MYEEPGTNVTVIDRIAMAIWLSNNGKKFFNWSGEGHYYTWANNSLRPFIETIYGKGRIDIDVDDDGEIDEHLGTVLVRTVDAAASKHYGRRPSRDPVLAALGEHNHAGRHVYNGEIGLAEIPAIYSNLAHDVGGALSAVYREYERDRPSDYIELHQEGGNPICWHESEDTASGYVLDEDYEFPLVIEKILAKQVEAIDAQEVIEQAVQQTLDETPLRDQVQQLREQHQQLRQKHQQLVDELQHWGVIGDRSPREDPR